MINIYEIEVKASINNVIELNKDDGIKIVRDLVNRIVVESLGLDFHNTNKYKNYVYDGLEKTLDNYKDGDKVRFRIRTSEISLIGAILPNAKGVYTNHLKVLNVDLKAINGGVIDKIYTLTPVVLKFEEGYWRANKSLDVVEDRIKTNLIKKYNNFYNTKLDEDFELFESIEIKNKYPINTKYKNITLLADKFDLTIAKNDMAQKLIYFAIGAGLGEMNAEGYGFIIPTWI